MHRDSCTGFGIVVVTKPESDLMCGSGLAVTAYGIAKSHLVSIVVAIYAVWKHLYGDAIEKEQASSYIDEVRWYKFNI